MTGDTADRATGTPAVDPGGGPGDVPTGDPTGTPAVDPTGGAAEPGGPPLTVDISWWDLDGSGRTVDALRARLDAGDAADWQAVPGLRAKYWLADRARNRWGAVMVWDGPRPDTAQLPPNRAAELIGRPPAQRVRFEVAAAVEPSRPQPPHPRTGG